MKLMEWFGLSTRSEEPTTPPGVTPPSRAARESVTESSALSLVAVYRSIQILGTAASQLTLDTWRGTETIPAPLVVRRPHVDVPLGTWLSMTVSSLALSGDAFWRVEKNSRGEVINLDVLDPWKAQPLEDGTLSYGGKTLKRSEFAHLRLMPRAGQRRGLGPIQAARAELAGALDLRDYSSGWFASGDTPSGVLTSDQHLTDDAAKRYKAAWAEREAHEVAVMGAGLSYEPILLNPEDAQFLQVRQFSTTEIARLFGIPAHMLLAAVEGTSLTYSNMQQADLAFVRWSLMAYLRAIEEAMSEVLPRGTTARFNLDGILRPDVTTRYAAHAVGIKAGFLTVDEVRAIEGLSPLPAAPAIPEGPLND